MNDSAIEIVCKLLGSQAALAKAMNVSPYAVTKWKKKKVPAGRVIDIEKAVNGRVTRYQLRPDLYPRDHVASV